MTGGQRDWIKPLHHRCRHFTESNCSPIKLLSIPMANKTKFAGGESDRERKKLHNRKNSLFAQSKNSKYDQDILRLEVWHLIVFIPGTRSTKPSSIVLVTFHTCKRNSVAIKYSSSFWSPSHDKEKKPASNLIVLLLFECQQKRKKWNQNEKWNWLFLWSGQNSTRLRWLEELKCVTK